jgi:hypothetical protein
VSASLTARLYHSRTVRHPCHLTLPLRVDEADDAGNRHPLDLDQMSA